MNRHSSARFLSVTTLTTASLGLALSAAAKDSIAFAELSDVSADHVVLYLDS